MVRHLGGRPTTDRASDNRDASADEHWETFGRKWTALLANRHLGKQTPQPDTGVESVTMAD
jgi:hypothetical protein